MLWSAQPACFSLRFRRAGSALGRETEDSLCQQGVDPLQVQLLKPVMMAPSRQIPFKCGATERNCRAKAGLRTDACSDTGKGPIHSFLQHIQQRRLWFLILWSPYGDGRLACWDRIQVCCKGGTEPSVHWYILGWNAGARGRCIRGDTGE